MASFILVEQTDQRFLYQIVAINPYYGIDTARFDTALLDAD